LGRRLSVDVFGSLPLLGATAPTTDVTEAAPAAGPLIALLAFGIALLLILILRLKLQAFLALLVVSVAVAASSRLVNPDAVPLTQVANTIVDSMGGALGFIATIIGIGAIFGAILEHSGGTQSLAKQLVRAFGPEKASWAMLLTGFVISIPVFLDVALVILAPLLFALARDTKRPYLYFGLPLVSGLAVTHAFVPPTPGPVAVAYLLGVNLGWVILFGVMVGLPTAIICGPWMCRWLADRVVVPPIDEDAIVAIDDENLPSLKTVLTFIGLPISMILANTVVEQWVARDLPDGLGGAERASQLAELLANADAWVQAVTFLGHPVIALLATTIAALYFLGTRRGVDRETLLQISTQALGPAGIIILITGAGGVFKGVLKSTGITDALVVVFADSGISVLVLAWAFATLIRVAQGSATVAMLTAAGLIGNFVTGLNQPQLALVTVVIAAGATGFSHVNDSGFWMISRYLRMTEGQTLRTWGVISTMISLVGFSLTLVLWQFIG